jgi:uncharacterized membrane protein SirB2
MAASFFTLIYFIVLLFASLTAIARVNSSPRAVVFLCCYIWLGLISELLSYFSILKNGENYLISNFYDYFCLVLILGYFLYQQNYKPLKNYYWIGVLLLLTLLGIISLCFKTLSSSHYSNLEMATSLVLLLFAFRQIYQAARDINPNTELLAPPLSIPLLFVANQQINLWCKSAAYANPYLQEKDLYLIFYLVVGSNIIFYAALALILLFSYRKKT